MYAFIEVRNDQRLVTFFFPFFFFLRIKRLGVKSIKIYTIVLVLLFYMLSSKTCICIVVNLSHFVL